MSLRSRVNESAMKAKLQTIEDFAKKDLLRFWQIHSPHFVDHGIVHCQNIESVLDRMIPSNVLEKMSEYELFLLLCGVWLHDIGMLFKEEGETNDQVRETHHERSRKLIRKGLPKIDLNEDERYVVGEIAFYHRKNEDIGNAKEHYEIQQDWTISKIRLRFLCALVRLADGCEIAHTRSSRDLVGIAGVNAEARFHHEAHLHVSAVSFDHKTHEIVISIRVKNKKDEMLLDNFLKGNLEKELASVKQTLKENGVEYCTVKSNPTIDAYAEEMPHDRIDTANMALEERLAEFEKSTGYYPSMTIETDARIHVFYETIAQTKKEIQNEILAVIDKIWNVFPEKDRIVLTLNTIYDPRRTLGDTDPEIMTVISGRNEFKEYQREDINKGEFWMKLVFLKKGRLDQFHKVREKFNWPLVV